MVTILLAMVITVDAGGYLLSYACYMDDPSTHISVYNCIYI